MERITANCLCCNRIITDVTSAAKGHVVFCPDCAEINKEVFEAKGIPYSSPTYNYGWWDGTEYDAALNEVPKLSEKFQEKCDHCNKALDQSKISKRYLGDIIWCASCVKEEDKFLTSCGIAPHSGSTSPKRWEGVRATKILKDYPQRDKTADYQELMCPCDHCGEELPYKDIPEGYEAPWCEVCFTEDLQLLKDHNIPNGAYSKDRKIQAWQHSAPKVKRIPKKVVMPELITETKIESKAEEVKKASEIVCDHCDVKIRTPPNSKEDIDVIWCETCCNENVKFFTDNNVTQYPSISGLHWRKWAAPNNTVPLRSLPKKSVKIEATEAVKVKIEEVQVEASKICCGHCSDEIIDPPVGEVREGEMIWCETCCTEHDATFIFEKLNGAGIKNSTGKWRRWELSSNVATLKAFPKKVLKVESTKIEDKVEESEVLDEEVKKVETPKICCDHCATEIVDPPIAEVREDAVIWCETCCNENFSFVNKELTGPGAKNPTSTYRRWTLYHNIKILKNFPKKAAKIEEVKPVITVAAEATNTEVLRTEVTVLPVDRLVSCDHCNASINVGDMPDLTIYWCSDCCKTDRSLLNAKGGVFYTKEDVEKGTVTYRNAIKKDDGTIVYAGWKARAPQIQEIPKKNAVKVELSEETNKAKSICDHCDKPLNTTSKPTYLVYWCNGCVVEEKGLLHEKGLALHSANSTDEFHGWKDSYSIIKTIPKKLTKPIEPDKKFEEVKTCNCKHCGKTLDRKSIWTLSNEVDPFVWCKECIISNREKTKEQLITLTIDFYSGQPNVLGECFVSRSEIAKLEAITAESKKDSSEKKEETPVEISTCECGACGKSLKKDSIYKAGIESFDYVWCKECLTCSREELNHLGIFFAIGEASIESKYLGEAFTPNAAKVAKDFLSNKEAKKIETCECGFCGKSLEKKSLYPTLKEFNFVLCKECALTHKEKLYANGVITVSAAYYATNNHNGEEFNIAEEIEKLKTYLGAMKEALSEKKDEIKVIHITTNCGHCAKSLDIVAAPNYDIYWCHDCVEEEKELLYERRIPVESCVGYTENFVGWKDSANAVKAIGTKEELAKYRVLKAEENLKEEAAAAQKEAERIKSCTTNCNHCNKSIVFARPVKSNTVEVLWCRECSIEDKKLLETAGVPNNFSDQHWDSSKSLVENIQRKISCAHCGARVYNTDGAGRKHDALVWCKDCTVTNSQFLIDKGIIHIRANEYETTKYDGEGWRNSGDVEILKKVPMKSEKNCTCDHCGATFHDASFEAGMVAWCKDCCGEKADLLKEVAIPGLETESSLEGKVWGLKKNVGKVKLIAKKGAVSNDVCDHCGTVIYFRETSTSKHIAWCRNCVNKDFSILQSMDQSDWRDKIVNGQMWFDHDDCFEKVKAVPKVPNTVCDHCDKKFFAQCIATAPNQEYVSWCQDCCHTDAEMLKTAGASFDGKRAGINGYNWTQEDYRITVDAIEKKANATCDHCEKKMRVKPEHLSPDAIYWCNDCAVLDEKELKKLNLPVSSTNKYHSWIVNAARVKSIAKKSAIVRETSGKVMLTGHCPCHVCSNPTTDYNFQYKDLNRWYNTCHGCSVRISEIKNPGCDTSGISQMGSGSVQKEVDQEGHAVNKAVKQAIEEFNIGKKVLEDVAAKEIEEIAAKAAARASEIKAEIAKKEAGAIRVGRLTEELFFSKEVTDNMDTPTKQTTCHICSTSCPDWGDPWTNFCESCALKIAKVAGKTQYDNAIREHHGIGFTESYYREAIKGVKKQFVEEKEVAATITRMFEVVENTMAKIDAVALPVEKIQEIINNFDKAIALDQGTLDTMAKVVGSKAAPKLEKLEVAKRIIDALSDNAYPFGGFVRDLYAFEDFKDVDFFFPRFDTDQYPTNRFSGFEKCVLALKEKGFTLQALEEEKPLYVETHHTKLIKKSYLVTDTKTGLSINVDLVRTNAGRGNAKYDTPFLALDADVNSLFFDKKTQAYKAASGYGTAKVIRNIENKVFELANNGEVLTKRINKLTEKGYTPTKNMTIDKTLLKVGDLVSLVISNPDSGASFIREATVFSTENGEVRVVLSSVIENTSGNSWGIVDSKDATAVKKIGKTIGSELLGWSIDTNTKITALHGNVFPPPPPLDYKLLNIGDKVEIEYSGVDGAGNKFSYLGDGVIIDIGDMDKGIYPIATITKNSLTNPFTGASVSAGGNTSSTQSTLMQAYSIPATNVIRLDTSLKATKVTGKMELPPIDQLTLNLGDKVELEINLRGSNFTRTDEKVTKTAWVVGITSGIRHFALESPAKSVDGSTSPCYYVPDYTEYHLEAKRLGIDCNTRNGWKFVSDNTKIRKVLEKAPPLIDPLTVEVGDRCEVEIQPGRSGVATCIQKQSNGNPCWAFDKIPGMNLNSPNSTEIPLYQKYGVPVGSYTYWVNEPNTKIRKNVGHVDHCFVEHKTLNVGDVIDVEIVYSGRSHGTVTGIVAEIDSNGNKILTINKQIPSLTSTPTGVYAHAANVMGWDSALCGTWCLQPTTDKVFQKIETKNLDIRPFSEFRIGDLVEVEVLNGGINFKTEALIGGIPQTGTVSLILKNRSDVATNCDSNLKKVAEKYGFETESTAYSVNSSIAVIHKALGKANIKSLPPNSLKVGDRIEVCFGHEFATTAVVIQSADESPYKEPIIAFEAETNGCWPLDQKQKDLAFKYGITAKKVGRRVDGNTTFVTKVIGRKSLSAGNLKLGDRLKLEFGASFSACTPLPEGATVISSSGDTAVVVLDEVYRDLSGNVNNSKFPTNAEKELAKKVGVDIADNDARIFAFSNSGAIVIKDIKSADETQPDKQMVGIQEETINPASLQTGDRILMEIKEANGDEYEVEATALGIDYNGFPLVFLDEEMAKAFVFTQAANIKACEALGFDPKERRGWDLNPAKTKILEILDDKHEIEIEDVRIGDRIQVEFRDDDEVLFTKEGIYVGEDETSGLPVVYFTETISVGEEESWQAEKNTVPYLAAEKLGFTPNTDQYMNLDYDIVIRKIVARSKVELLQSNLETEASDLQAEEPDEVEEEEEEDEEYINPYTLEAGDKVEVKIVASQDEDSYITQMATVIDPDDVNGPLLALDEDFDLGEDEVKPDSFKSLGKEINKKAKQLGINPDKKVAWNVDDYTTIIKVLSKSTNNSADAQNKEENMPYDTDGEEITMLDMLKADALSAGYRVAANQMTKGVKGALLLSMKDKGMDGGKIQAISEMLDTEMGEALISTLLGYGLTYIPGLGEDPRAQTLAEEFRINGIATAGNVIADSLFQHLLPAINSAMASLPPAEEVLRLKKPARKRIATPKVEEKALVEATGGEEPVKAASKRSSGATA